MLDDKDIATKKYVDEHGGGGGGGEQHILSIEVGNYTLDGVPISTMEDRDKLVEYAEANTLSGMYHENSTTYASQAAHFSNEMGVVINFYFIYNDFTIRFWFETGAFYHEKIENGGGDENECNLKEFTDPSSGNVGWGTENSRAGSIGYSSVTFGNGVEASGNTSFAIGLSTRATSDFSYAEGMSSQSTGMASHAEGNSVASGMFAHAEGQGKATVDCAHAEGNVTEANGYASHAEGVNTVADGGSGSHAEGNGTKTVNDGEHAEGSYNISMKLPDGTGTLSTIGMGGNDFERKNAFEMWSNGKTYFYGIGGFDGTNSVVTNESGEASFNPDVKDLANALGGGSGGDCNLEEFKDATTPTDIGWGTKGSRDTSKAVGANSLTFGAYHEASALDSFAEGNSNHAKGWYSHSEGNNTTASGRSSHTEGVNTQANSEAAHAEGYGSKATNEQAHAEGFTTTASGISAHSEGQNTTASGNYSHAEGERSQATKASAHAEGRDTQATGPYSHAEGDKSTAASQNSHAEGFSTIASGEASHAEGGANTADGYAAHAEGEATKAYGDDSHAEGNSTITRGNYSHAEGSYTEANGIGSHSEGHFTSVASNADYGHAEGYEVTATNEAEHAQGKYNASHTGTRDSVGIGTADTARKNATETMNDGRHFILGVGGYDGTNPDTARDLAKVLNQPEYFNAADVFTTPSGCLLDITKANSGNYIFVSNGVAYAMLYFTASISNNATGWKLMLQWKNTWKYKIDNSFKNNCAFRCCGSMWANNAYVNMAFDCYPDIDSGMSTTGIKSYYYNAILNQTGGVNMSLIFPVVLR